MNLNLSALLGRNDEESVKFAKRQEIEKLFRIYDSRVTAGVATRIPPELTQRMWDFLNEMPAFSKRDLSLTGLDQLMEVCERAPGQRVPELKLGSFDSRAQTSIGFRIPLEMDDRLRKLLRSLPGVTKRDVISAALDLILTRCETINGGPFPTVAPDSVSAGKGQ